MMEEREIGNRRDGEGRRRFFGRLGRVVGAVGLGGLAWWLQRGGAPDAEEANCERRGLCPGCKVLNGCTLPRADVFRRARAAVEERGHG